jgi:LysM repeat protein
MGQLAARYGTSTRAIKAANGLSSSFLRAGRAYRIPVRAAAPPSTPVIIPYRLLPPSTPATMASATWPTATALYGDNLNLRLENPALLARAVYVF